MKKLLIFVLAFVSLGAAQQQTGGSLTASGATCATSGACISLHFEFNDVASASIQLSGTFTATVQFEASSDGGATWVAISGTPLNSGTAASSATTANTWKFSVASLTDIRARASAWTSAPTVVIRSSKGDPASAVSSAVGAGAAGATTTGNPVLIGCAFETSPTTVSSGQTNNVHCDSSGRPIVTGSFASGQASAVSLPGMPMMCDTATSGTVTAAQAQMVRCTTGGALVTIQSAGTTGDTLSVGNPSGLMAVNGVPLPVIVTPWVYNGAAFDRLRTADLTNYNTVGTLTAANSIGAVLTEKGSRWSVIHNPAANSQASASIASEASVRHVVDCVSFSAGATTAPALTALTINIRDGASGAGTIIWTYQVIIPAATGQSVAPHSICGLNLVGTTATAMTVEFSASLANLIESVSISGFNVN